MKIAKYTIAVVACLIFGLGNSAFAQQSTNTNRRGGELLNLLRNRMVQEELELVGEQSEQIEAIMDEMTAEIRERSASVRNLPVEERRTRYQELREELAERRDEYQEQIKQVLLPNQISRLRQMSVQRRASGRGEGMIGVLMDDTLLEEMGVDKETREKLKEKTKEVLERLKKEIVELRKKAEKEILSVLPSEQRKTVMETVGEPFDFSGGARGPFGTHQRRLAGPDSRGGRTRSPAASAVDAEKGGR